MTADPPSFMADVAAQVVAWHNRHPLARRIARKDVQGIGVLVLPFARDGQRPWHDQGERRGLLALMFAPRQRRRQWPVFSEDALPGIGPRRLAAFAQRQGFDERPGPADLPERVLVCDRDLIGDEGAALPPERYERYLLTAALDIGPDRPRLVMGRGRRPAVLGRRLWSLPRLAALGGAALVAATTGVAALWLTAMAPRSDGAGAAASATRPPAASAASVASVAAAASVTASGAGGLPAAAASTPVATAVPAPVAAASAVVMPAASTAAARAAAATPAAPVAAAPPSAPPSARPSAPIALPGPPAAASAGPPALALPPQPVQAQRASAPLVPRLKPDLAAAAREQAQRSGLAASAAAAPAPMASGPARPAAPGPLGTGPATAPAAAEPGARPAAAASAPRFYALVTRPVRSQAEAEALLRRLRTETDRINHPTASQTELQQTPQGWRVVWWPFTHTRQAENARAALARRVELELLEF